MKFPILLSLLAIYFACTPKKPSDTADPNSAILIVKNEDGTFSKEPLHLEHDELILKRTDPVDPQLTILTESPPGNTLGDASAASKLLQSIADKAESGQQSYNNFWIIRSKRLSFNAFSLIPKNVPTLIIEDWGALRKPKLHDTLSSTSMFLSFPTFHYLNNTDVDFLNSFSAQYVRCTEYDFMGLSDISHPHLPILKTGFCPSCLGIFIEKPSSPRTHNDSIAPIDRHLDNFLEKLELSGKVNQESLYFGYFNKEYKNELKNTWTNLVNFATVVSLKGMLESANKDLPLSLNIVIPADKRQFKQIKEQIHSLSRSAHLLAPKLIKILQNTSIHYHKLEREKFNMDPNVSSEHTIRIINPFPLAKSTMLAMLASSNPLSGLTGDQTFSEGLQFGKIPFYQIMHWKKLLHENFSSYLFEQLGEQSKLGSFFANFSRNETANIDFLVDQAHLLEKNHLIWAMEMLTVRENIYKERNLEKNLAPKIQSLMEANN